LDPTCNRTLRLVCHAICSAVEPLALSHLSIDVKMNTINETIEKLEAYAKHRTRATDYVRTVSISSLCPAERPSHWPTWEYMAGFVGNPRVHRLQVEDDFQNALSAALFALNSVRALSWCTHRYDPNWAFGTISAYVTIRRVQELSISFTAGCHPNLAFLDMGGLHTLCFDDLARPGVDNASIVVALATVIENSPDLENLSITTGSCGVTNNAPTLGDFFPKRLGRPPMQLKSLSLHTVRILLDATTLYHLRSLESLSIHFNITTSIQGQSLPAIWKILGTESIHLKKVNVNIVDVEDELLDYLSSYEGIRDITFDNNEVIYSTTEANVFASRFFHDVLPRIAGTLEKIAQCKQLKELTVSVVDLIQSHSQDVVSCLEQTAAILPKLVRLQKINVATVPQIG
ncbi:hypothetical protein BDZ97DRAFT_1826785, partial [Flammula alnicola]